MLVKDQLDTPIDDQTVDLREVQRFDSLAEEWWDPNSKLQKVHQFNETRLHYIVTCIKELLDLTSANETPLMGINIVDVGCGSGLMCEPLAKLGANVTGIDATARNIEIARRHCRKSGLSIDYHHDTVRSLVTANKSFNVVLNLEVVEHVTNPKQFIQDCASIVRPGGLMITATLNRTLKAWALAIIGAEYVLRWLPRGTHDWRRFLSPREISAMTLSQDIETRRIVGIQWNLLNRLWEVSRDPSVNYLLVSEKMREVRP